MKPQSSIETGHFCLLRLSLKVLIYCMSSCVFFSIIIIIHRLKGILDIHFLLKRNLYLVNKQKTELKF